MRFVPLYLCYDPLNFKAQYLLAIPHSRIWPRSTVGRDGKEEPFGVAYVFLAIYSMDGVENQSSLRGESENSKGPATFGSGQIPHCCDKQ